MRPSYAKDRGATEMAAKHTNVALDHLAKLRVASKEILLNKLAEAASKKTQSHATLSVAKAFLTRALKEQDMSMQRRSVRIAHKMLVALGKAFPDTDPQVIGDVVADLDSLWDLRQKLDKDLKKLFQMRFPQDCGRLHSFLIDIEVRQLDEASYLIRRLRKRLPTLLRALDRQGRSRHRRARNKPAD